LVFGISLAGVIGLFLVREGRSNADEWMGIAAGLVTVASVVGAFLFRFWQSSTKHTSDTLAMPQVLKLAIHPKRFTESPSSPT
jgi:hypothetical protein